MTIFSMNLIGSVRLINQLLQGRLKYMKPESQLIYEAVRLAPYWIKEDPIPIANGLVKQHK
jgi:hypothetical protein